MKKIVSAALLGVLLFAVPARADEKAAVTGTTLDISAEAQVKAAPDLAEISAGVVTMSATANRALEQNTLRMNNLFKALKAAGVAEKDIQTSMFNISPQYEYKQDKPPRITSYQVSDTVSLRLRDLKDIGAVMDALVAEGANQIDGPRFSVENPDSALDGVRQQAVSKALKRAQLYAAAAGLKVKRIISISEQTGFTNPTPRPMMMKAMAFDGASAASTPVASGEVSLSVTVNMQFELTPS